MQKDKKLEEMEFNPFDAPTAGQSLTDNPGEFPWENPPDYTDLEEAFDYIFDRTMDPEVLSELMDVMKSGIPVEALVKTVTFAGFQGGKWSVDMAELLSYPVVQLFTTIAAMANFEPTMEMGKQEIVAPELRALSEMDGQTTELGSMDGATDGMLGGNSGGASLGESQSEAPVEAPPEQAGFVPQPMGV